MGTAMKHPVPDRVKPSFVIFDIWALWRSNPGNSGHQRVNYVGQQNKHEKTTDVLWCSVYPELEGRDVRICKRVKENIVESETDERLQSVTEQTVTLQVNDSTPTAGQHCSSHRLIWYLQHISVRNGLLSSDSYSSI